jgi:hypothetical protein
MAYATGKYAHGFCDRCGFRYDLADLKNQVIDQKPSGLLVCPECMDIDHEQLQLGRFRIYDPESLQNPRPDISLAESRKGHGDIWMAKGTLTITGHAPTVTTS